jgi:hypothetical protein
MQSYMLSDNLFASQSEHSSTCPLSAFLWPWEWVLSRLYSVIVLLADVPVG